MNKSDIAWVGIRLLGLWFLVLAFDYMLELGTAAHSVLSETSTSWGVNKADRWNTVFSVGIRLGAFIVFYLGLSFYFLVKGRYAHQLVMRGSVDDET